MEKYGFEDIATWDDLRNFYMTIAEKEDGIYASQGGPWYQYFHNKGMYGAGGTPNNGELILIMALSGFLLLILIATPLLI